MREPLFDTLLPGNLANPGPYRRSADPEAEKIVILQDVYPVAEVHQAVPQICRRLCASAGVRLIAVEGASGPLRLPASARSAEAVLQLFPGLSRAVVNTLLLALPGVAVEGVDDMARHAEGQQAQVFLHGQKKVHQEVFARIADRLGAAQERLYPPELRDLRRSILQVYGRRGELRDQVDLVKRAAGRSGLDLRPLSSLQAFDEALTLEQQIDFARTEEERTRLVLAFVNGLFDALAPDAARRVPEDRCAAVLRLWMRRSGITEAELERICQLRGFPTILAECRDALVGWATQEALSLRLGEDPGGQAPLLEGMLQLVAALDPGGQGAADLPNLVRYVHYLRVAREGLDSRSLVTEIPQWSRLLVDSLGSPPADELRRLEDEIDLLYLGLGMELSPELAEAAPLAAGELEARIGRLEELAGGIAGGGLEARAAELGRSLTAASVFYTRALARGGIMAANTLALMRRRLADRAIVIAGGFHPRTLTTLLEDDRRVSWSVISPKFQNLPVAYYDAEAP